MAYPKIEGERLDLQRLREKSGSSAIPAAHEFEALLSRPPGKPAVEGSAEAELIDFVRPVVKDSGIFQESHILTLLQHLHDIVLPQLNKNNEMTAEAFASVRLVVQDEITRFSDLRERRHEVISA